MVDFDNQVIEKKIDWQKDNIDWRGYDADRGLRGIAFDKETIYIATSNELRAYNKNFSLIDSWQITYLKYCQDMFVWERTLFIVSAGYDSVLRFNLDKKIFEQGIHIEVQQSRFKAILYDPYEEQGPLLLNKLDLNSVYCAKGGMYIGGSRKGMLHFNGQTVLMAAELPEGNRNARPFRDGVLFNDAKVNCVRYCGRSQSNEDRAMKIPKYDIKDIDSEITPILKQGRVRGLAVLSNSIIAVGSAPATITIFNLAKNKKLGSVNLEEDISHAITCLVEWPFD